MATRQAGDDGDGGGVDSRRFKLPPLPRMSFKTRVDAGSRSAGGALAIEAGDLLLRASCSDETFLNGPSLDGLSLGVEKPGSFAFDYDVGSGSPRFQFTSVAKVGGRPLSLTYTHQHSLDTTMLEGSIVVDPRNKFACSYDFSKQAGRVRYAFSHELGMVLEPAFDFGTKSWDFSAIKRVSKDDKLALSYKGFERVVSFEWCRSGGAQGPFKLYADVPLADGKPPKLMVEKTWNY